MKVSKAKQKELRQRAHLMRKYGITLEYRNKIIRQQRECCPICGQHQSLFKHGLGIEHDHSDNRIRGAVCYYCNYRVIGKTSLKHVEPLIKYYIRAYPEVREAIAAYLRGVESETFDHL